MARTKIVSGGQTGVDRAELLRGCSNGCTASGGRTGAPPRGRRAGRLQGCTNGPAIGEYRRHGGWGSVCLLEIAIVQLRTPDLSG